MIKNKYYNQLIIIFFLVTTACTTAPTASKIPKAPTMPEPEPMLYGDEFPDDSQLYTLEQLKTRALEDGEEKDQLRVARIYALGIGIKKSLQISKFFLDLRYLSDDDYQQSYVSICEIEYASAVRNYARALRYCAEATEYEPIAHLYVAALLADDKAPIEIKDYALAVKHLYLATKAEKAFWHEFSLAEMERVSSLMDAASYKDLMEEIDS